MGASLSKTNIHSIANARCLKAHHVVSVLLSTYFTDRNTILRIKLDRIFGFRTFGFFLVRISKRQKHDRLHIYITLFNLYQTHSRYFVLDAGNKLYSVFIDYEKCLDKV